MNKPNVSNNNILNKNTNNIINIKKDQSSSNYIIKNNSVKNNQKNIEKINTKAQNKTDQINI